MPFKTIKLINHLLKIKTKIKPAIIMLKSYNKTATIERLTQITLLIADYKISVKFKIIIKIRFQAINKTRNLKIMKFAKER